MQRNLARLGDDTFDVIVVGGGIYGLSTAYALTRRGLSVALLERRDFGGATSFNSLKTVHGGIRPLQHGAIAEAREFVRERRAIATMAPHLVRVMPFVVPTARHPIRNRLAMRLFLLAYDAISRDRNEDLDPAVRLPGSYTVGRRRATELNPFVDRKGLTGAAVWHDYQLHSPERFAIALLRTITDRGAVAANYVEVRHLLRKDDRVFGVHAVDTLTGSTIDVRGRLVINAAGPWTWQLLAASGVTAETTAGFSLAMNLVVDRAPLPHATGGLSRGRFLFLVPWRDRSILGTSHEGFIQDPRCTATRAQIEGLLRDGAEAFPGANLTAGSIRLVHRGLLPARPGGSAHGALLKRSIIRDHRADGVSGLISVVGVRYTTAGATAQQAARLACDLLGRPAQDPPIEPLAGAAFAGLTRFCQQHPGRERLIARYGTLFTELPADGLDPIAPGTDVTRAEILYAVRREMAVTLADVALRRTDLASGGHPGPEALRAAAITMAVECGWDNDRITREIASVESELAV
jgi:glycerol-3-phosphate dehydrogenase